MATLPKPDLTPHPMTATELLAIRGTPEFNVEYRRQLAAVNEHNRKAGGANIMSIDWEWLDKVWK